MATVTSTPTSTSLTINGNTQANGTISWSLPSIPSGATVTSRVLTGVANANMSKGSATVNVNNTRVTNGTTFTINLGANSTSTSVSTTGVGNNKNANGTVTFSNLVYTVTYELSKTYYTVTFVDWNGTVLKEQSVEEGTSATPPSNPTREGYNFIGWDKNFSNITSNLTIIAIYEEIIIVQNLYIGGTKINNVRVGNNEITKIYIGNNLIYEKSIN